MIEVLISSPEEEMGWLHPTKRTCALLKVPATAGSCSKFRCPWCRFHLVSTEVSVILLKIPRLYFSLDAKICRAGGKMMEVQIGDRLPTHYH